MLTRLYSTERTYAPLPLSRLQQFIAQARIPTTEPITLNTLITSDIVHGLSNKFSGIKLLGDIDPSLPLPPLKLYLSRFSKSAAKAVIDAGGEVTAVYRNKLGLRAEKRGAVDQIKMADPTRKNDIGESFHQGREAMHTRHPGLCRSEYYSNPRRYGYLTQQGTASPTQQSA